MKEIRRLSAIAFAILLMALVAACGGSDDNNTEASGTPAAMTDQANRSVEVPEEVERVVSVHPMGTYLVWRLTPEKQANVDQVFSIINLEQDAASKYSHSLTLPDEALDPLRELPVTPTYFMGLDAEQIIGLDPDVVLTMNGDTEADASQDQMGIPFFALSKAPMESIEETIRNVGKIVGNEEQATEMADFWADTLAEVAERADAAEGEPPTVMYTGQGGEPGTTPGSDTIFGSLIDLAGGKNVADELPDTSNEGNEISPEQVATWDPDMIIAADTGVREKLQQDPRWKGLRAVREDNVMVSPNLARLDGYNALVGLVWSQLIFSGASEAEIRETLDPTLKKFYELFYDRTVTDEEIAEPATT